MNLTRKIIFLTLLLVSAVSMSAAENKPENQNEFQNLEKATFAGGCFWCMEASFEKSGGIISVVSGYTGGKEVNPAYKDVSAGKTGHAESIEIVYDPKQVSYEKLLDIFWQNIDPTTIDRQFNDVGKQYRTAIFYHNEEQRRLAETSKAQLDKDNVFGQKIVTQIVPAGPFYPAEESHQDYHTKNPIPYKYYKFLSGRDRYTEKIWGKDKKKPQ